MPSLARQQAMSVFTLMVCLLAGCSNPGPPRPPSLQIPAAVSDLSATRRGGVVELRFTLPERTTDGVLLRSGTVKARLCRAVALGSCQPLGLVASSDFAVPQAPKTPAHLQDILPQDLASGVPRLLTYRVALSNGRGSTSGFSGAAYAAAGASPPRVLDLAAQGSRLGVVLTWQPAARDAELLLQREDLNPDRTQRSAAKPFKEATPHSKSSPFKMDKTQSSPIVLLNAAGGTQGTLPDKNAAATLDTTAVADTPYRYTAERRRTVQVEGHKLELWSVLSEPVLFTLHDTFPPPAPTELSVAGFLENGTNGAAAAFAVDLIWEPVQDEQLAGYNVYRQIVGANDAGEKVRLTPVPVKLPAFHDTTASGSKRYRYNVTSIDLKGNESPAATAVLEPQRF